MNETRHPSMTFDERYRAISSRDTRFDGQFVTAVRTTGIYCRPSCPARTPQPGNVSFFATSAAAHEAGYRACKRCLPEAAPGSPEWDLRGDAAGRAMRLIADGVVEREGVPGLAARLGYSPRHLTRMLAAELGAGPLALARAQRAHTARMLLVGTALTAAEVAFSAGFSSVRQFNDTVREVFGLTPTQLRARGSRGAMAPAEGAGVRLALPYRRPFDAAGLFAWMSARAIAGVEAATSDSFARNLRLPGGAAWFRIRDVPGEGRVALEARVARPADLGMVVTRVRRLFDLDADPLAIDEALSTDPRIAARVRAVPGLRVPGAADPHEMLIRAMVGQQITVVAARTALTRLTLELGERLEGAIDAGEKHGERLFPTMSAIAEHGAEVLRGPRARIRAITAVAAALASGELELGPGDDPVQQRATLLALPGVGPWTADYVRMRVTGDPDVFLPGDVAVRSGAVRAGLPGEPRALTALAGGFAPWRSYLTGHLWRAAADVPASGPLAAASIREEERVPDRGTRHQERQSSPKFLSDLHRPTKGAPV